MARKDGVKGLASDVDDAGGVLALTLGELRDAVGAEKLGKLVMERIKNELKSAGLGYFPREVLEANEAPRQTQAIRIYRLGNNSAARAISAVLNPTPAGDQFLSDLAANPAQDILARIRELVCDE